MSANPEVRIGTLRIRLAALREAPARYSHAFAEAKVDPGHGWCLCGPVPRRLVIRRKSHSGSAAVFFLAGWPDEGEAHDVLKCPFYKEPEHESGQSSESKSCFSEDADGTFHITPAYSVSLKINAATRTPDPIEQADKPTTSTRGSTLLATLQYLWAKAGLHRWRAGWDRDWGRVRYELELTAQNGKMGKHSLSDVLYVPPRYAPASADRNRELLNARLEPLFASTKAYLDAQTRLAAGKSASAVKETLFIIAPLRSIKPGKYGSHVFQLGHIGQPVYCKASLMERLERRFGRVLNTLTRGEGHVVGIFQVEGTTHKNLQLMDAGLMRVANRFIPVESSYEETVADALVAADRDFTKPIRLEISDDTLSGKVLPDFILYDTSARRCYMEVFGVQGREDYDARKKEKRQFYEQKGVMLWDWDLSSTSEMPSLPTRIPRSANPT